ncbi:hypothetical protein Ndes2526B_g08318 [Nannochloris sp. 'desiccata']
MQQQEKLSQQNNLSRDSGFQNRFVQVSADRTHLCLNEKPWYFCGANCYYLMTRAADPSTLPDVISVLDDLQAAGITVVRTWAFADGPQWSALQPSPGVFDENVFCALDRVIAEAGARGIRILFNLINFWSNYGGMGQYVAWSREAQGLPTTTHSLGEKKEEQTSAAAIASEFYQDPWCQSTFLNFLKTLILRTNTLTGVVYRDDPTILGFAPANEPQCLCDPGCHGSTIATWIHRTAAEIKKFDSNHLVFMDCEGFWGPGGQPSMTCTSSGAGGTTTGGGNPYDCTYNGCDFTADCASNYIDVACCHLYPDLWLQDASEQSRLEFAVGWLDAHVEACANILRKPLILSEFGKQRAVGTNSNSITTAREVYFQAIFNRCLNHMQQGRPLAGSMFWTAAAKSYPDYDGFTIYLPHKKQEIDQGEGDSVAELIKDHAIAVQKLNESQVDVGVGGSREAGKKLTIAHMVSRTKEKLESKLDEIRKKLSVY